MTAIHIQPDLPKKHDIRCTECNHLSEARVQSPHLCAWCDASAVTWVNPPRLKITLPKGARSVGPVARDWCMTA